MPQAGIEPARFLGHGGLSPACLPVPSLRHWLAVFDSNEDSQVQSLLSYRLNERPIKWSLKRGSNSQGFPQQVLSLPRLPVSPHRDGTRGGTWTHNLFRATRSKRVTYAFRHSGVNKMVEELGFEPRFSAFRKQRERPDFPIPRNGRESWIRTSGLLRPRQARTTRLLYFSKENWSGPRESNPFLNLGKVSDCQYPRTANWSGQRDSNTLH